MSYLNLVLRKSLISILLVLLFASCDLFKDDNPTGPTTETIEIGKNVSLGSYEIGISGGMMKINKKGDPLDGFFIEFPQSSYKKSYKFEISYSTIKSHKFGNDIKALTPLIQIKTNALYADSLIKINIPVKVPEGFFAMAFYLNEKTGELEGIPTLNHDDNFLTVVTRHFATSSLTGTKKDAKFPSILGLDNIANMMVLSIPENILTGKSAITTGYKPGFDDWEFYNMGSYLSPGGICTGQSITSIYYFYEFKQKYGTLWGKIDILNNPNPEVWMDNPVGYRLASIVQKDYNENMYNPIVKYLQDYSKLLGIESDKTTYYSFLFSMLLTGEPQIAGIWNTISGGGHALVIYGCRNGNLLVADPNFPGGEREIEYINSSFKPFASANNKKDLDDGKGITFDKIQYIAKTALVSWDQVGVRFDEASQGKQDYFGEYALCFYNGQGPGKHRYAKKLDDEQIFLDYFKDTCRFFIYSFKPLFVENEMTLYKLDPQKMERTIQLYVLEAYPRVNLEYGDNYFTAHIYNLDWITGIPPELPTPPHNWLDFMVIHVVRDSLGIKSSSSNPQVNEEFELSAFLSYQSKFIYDTRFEWDFDGDGKADKIEENVMSAKYKYSKPGVYNVILKVYQKDIDKYINTPITEAEIEINVGGGPNPIINSISPTEAKAGDILTIKGSGFGSSQGASKVTINGISALEILSWSENLITLKISDNISSGDVVVIRDGKQSNGIWLKILSNLKIESISPASANADDVITITGKGFGKTGDPISLKFSTVQFPFILHSEDLISHTDSEIKVKVPRVAISGDVWVEVNSNSSNKVKFTLKIDPLLFKNCLISYSILSNFERSNGGNSDYDFAKEHKTTVVDFKDNVFKSTLVQNEDNNSYSSVFTVEVQGRFDYLNNKITDIKVKHIYNTFMKTKNEKILVSVDFSFSELTLSLIGGLNSDSYQFNIYGDKNNIVERFKNFNYKYEKYVDDQITYSEKINTIKDSQKNKFELKFSK